MIACTYNKFLRPLFDGAIQTLSYHKAQPEDYQPRFPTVNAVGSPLRCVLHAFEQADHRKKTSGDRPITPRELTTIHNMFVDDLLRVCQASCRQLVLSSGLAEQWSPSLLERGWRKHTSIANLFLATLRCKKIRKSPRMMSQIATGRALIG